MRDRPRPGRASALPALLGGLLAGLLALAAPAPGGAAPSRAPAPLPLPAAGPPGPACADQAARYENGRGFTLFAIRAGEVRVVNPLRPLTPDLTHILEVVIGGKRATAYGADYAALHRGGPPGAMQTALGAPVTWAPSLPPLPDRIGIVAEDGTPLADLAFHACEPAPAAAPEAPPKVAGKGNKPVPKKAVASKPDATAKAPKAPAKTPSGFTMPSGALPE